jgi:polyhydroxyalkanoate synthase subunit PhaC
VTAVGKIRADPTVEVIGRSIFAFMDTLRKFQGEALEAFGFGPAEHPYRVVGAGPHWRLRDYGSTTALPCLLVVAAPIKRAYIWDLGSCVSPICHCLREGLHVYLLEWLPASRDTKGLGIDAYAEAISECVAVISRSAATKPFLIGHSLGGTLATVFGALAPERIRGLVLLGAPLCFAPASSHFRDALASLIPAGFSEEEPFPGSLLSSFACLASPSTFIWSRLQDAAASAAKGCSLEIHTRVERWALDELPLPGMLVYQIVQWLYREDRFCRGSLNIWQRDLGPANLTVPTLAVVNMADEIAPLASVKPCMDALPISDVRIIEYPGEVGVVLQHLATLVGRDARAHLWPEIITWIRDHSQGLSSDRDSDSIRDRSPRPAKPNERSHNGQDRRH